MTDTKSWAVVMVATVAVALTTWHREFGACVAGFAILAAAVLAAFCVVWFIRYNIGPETKPKGRAFYHVGQVWFWVLVAVLPCAIGWFVALKMMGE